jgi:hypothetical protein
MDGTRLPHHHGVIKSFQRAQRHLSMWSYTYARNAFQIWTSSTPFVLQDQGPTFSRKTSFVYVKLYIRPECVPNLDKLHSIRSSRSGPHFSRKTSKKPWHICSKRQVAQEPLEPPRGSRNMRKRVAPPPKYDASSLQGISFTLKAGEWVGLIGRTGSGKSTLVMSILRFASPLSILRLHLFTRHYRLTLWAGKSASMASIFALLESTVKFQFPSWVLTDCFAGRPTVPAGKPALFFKIRR